jgi:geranylgeranyl reductase family protein
MTADAITTDVAIVGAGPGGASCAYWLALRGHSVTLFEKKSFPRDKTCGDGLTPRSVLALEEMGLGDFLQTKHRYRGLRAVAFGKELEIPWPSHERYPNYGYVVTRAELDQAVAQRAEAVGASLMEHHEVIEARHEGDTITSLVVKNLDTNTELEVRARYYVLSEGANSRVARSLGLARDRSEPMGLAIRGYYSSPRASEPWIESHLDLRGDDGSVMPGYGWIFPLGDGRVNVGFGLLTNAARWKSINTTTAMEQFVRHADPSWELRPETALSAPTGGKLQMGHVVTPKRGTNYLAIGDTIASINPFNGEGISYAYETGHLAADALTAAIEMEDPRLLGNYEDALRASYEVYYRVARRFVKLISDPRVLSTSMWTAVHIPPLMSVVVRIMANLMRSERKGAPELLYDAVTATVLRR